MWQQKSVGACATTAYDRMQRGCTVLLFHFAGAENGSGDVNLHSTHGFMIQGNFLSVIHYWVGGAQILSKSVTWTTLNTSIIVEIEHLRAFSWFAAHVLIPVRGPVVAGLLSTDYQAVFMIKQPDFYDTSKIKARPNVTVYLQQT